MAYYDDQAPPIIHSRISYDPWGEPHEAPSDNDERRAIRDLIDGHLNWSPPQIKEHLRYNGRPDVTTAAICGVKAGM